jgi:hypothetical protein
MLGEERILDKLANISVIICIYLPEKCRGSTPLPGNYILQRCTQWIIPPQ